MQTLVKAPSWEEFNPSQSLHIVSDSESQTSYSVTANVLLRIAPTLSVPPLVCPELLVEQPPTLPVAVVVVGYFFFDFESSETHSTQLAQKQENSQHLGALD